MAIGSHWRRTAAAALAFAVALLALPAVAAPLLGQRDDFQDGSARGWTNGRHAEEPQVVPDGGPLGDGDRYLEIFANGTGAAGGRLVVYNQSQWIGAYPATITAVEMDIRTFSAEPLQMRLAFKCGFAANFSQFGSTEPFALVNDGEWHHVRFDLTEQAMTNLVGNGTPLATALTNVVDFRILHAAAPAYAADVVAATVGVDNVTAVTAPEPGGAILLVLGGLSLLGRPRSARASGAGL